MEAEITEFSQCNLSVWGLLGLVWLPLSVLAARCSNWLEISLLSFTSLNLR